MAFARRDWDALAASKDAQWLRERRRHGVAWCLRVADDLRRHVVLQRREWPKLIHYGVIFFLLEKLGAVIGVSNVHIYAAMRGETLEEFQKTRNAKVLYSVAGDSKQMTWDEGEVKTN